MTDSRNISLNQPVRPKTFSSSAAPHIRKYTAPGERDESTLKKQRPQLPLELYGGSGQVRTEQPAVRGQNIDITI